MFLWGVEESFVGRSSSTSPKGSFLGPTSEEPAAELEACLGVLTRP